MSLPSIDDLRVSKQVISTATLLKLVEKNGFDIRQGAGSHIIAAHAEFADVTLCLVRNTKLLSSQRDFIDAVDLIEQRRQNALSRQFEQSARDIRDTLDQKIPADLQYRLTEKGNIVLTDRAYPQIGVTFSQADYELAENKVHYLTGIKRDYAQLLGRLRVQYDANPPTFVKGAFDGRLSHAVYTGLPEVLLPDYREEDNPKLAEEKLYDYIAGIEAIDLDHAVRKEAALSGPFIIGAPLVTCAARRGERHNHVSYEGANGGRMHFTFNTLSNQRWKGDGKVARIAEGELQRLEKIVAGIERSHEGVFRKLAA